MEQWKNRVAVVTGASAGIKEKPKTKGRIIFQDLYLISGIGAAIAKDLVKAGMITIGLARRVENVEALKKDLPPNLQNNLHAVKCDVSKEEDIVRVFAWIETKFKGIDVLINNAGIIRQTELIKKDNSVPIREIIDTNVMGPVFCTREAYKSMEKHGRNSHVVHINSVVGHKVFCNLDHPSLNIYPPSKHALTAITEIHRQEFIRSKHHIKVTSVSPGAVKTEIIPDDYLETYGDFPLLQSEDVSHSVLHVLGTPPHVQIHELIIKPFGEKL